MGNSRERAKEILPMAFLPRKGQEINIYHMDFPAVWLEKLQRIMARAELSEKAKKRIPTKILSGNLNQWLSSIHLRSGDFSPEHPEDWVISLTEPDGAVREEIVRQVKTWLAVRLMGAKGYEKLTEEIKELQRSIYPDDLQTRMTTEVLFEDRKISDLAWRAYLLQIMQCLSGKTITLSGQRMPLYFCGRRGEKAEVITDILGTGNKRWSLVLKFSLETIPPMEKPMLVFHCVRRRWITGAWITKKADTEEGRKIPYLPDKCTAHIHVGNGHILQVPVAYEDRSFQWEPFYAQNFNLQQPVLLPEAEDVICHPDKYLEGARIIALPYKNGYDSNGFEKNGTGTGVSVKDRLEIARWLQGVLAELAVPFHIPRMNALSRIAVKKPKAEGFPGKLSAEEAAGFRERLLACAGVKKVHFEIWSKTGHEYSADKLEETLRGILGDTESFPIERKDLTMLGRPLDGKGRAEIRKRIDEVKDELPMADTLTAALVMLEGPEFFREKDPLQALRNGFAATGRLTQFIIPWKEKGLTDEASQGKGEKSEEKETVIISKQKSAVFDMFRQLGFLPKLQEKHNKELLRMPVIGVTLLRRIKLLGKPKKTVNIPMFVTAEPEKGRIFVESPLWAHEQLSYPEACLRLAEYSRQNNFAERCRKYYDLEDEFRSRLHGWKTFYGDEGAIIFIESKNGRDLCRDITNKAIHAHGDNMHPPMLSGISIADTKLRVLRIRENDEVPDYTAVSKDGKAMITSGIFEWEGDYWVIDRRPKQDPYTNSDKTGIMEKTGMNFDTKKMIEVYPVRLCPEDKAIDYVIVSTAWRENAVEYQLEPLALPIPMHFGEKLKEYILRDKG